MADKRQLKRGIRRLQHMKIWQLVVLLVLCSVVAATFLRLNNIGMVQRRDAVIAADKAGDKESIKARLYDLQRYVATHMNADMSSSTSAVTLENQYKRDYQAALDQASSTSNPNGNIYKKAQDACAPKFRRYSQAYLQCTIDYLSQFPPSANVTAPTNLPKASLYRYSFVSPLWTPDFAGFFVLICFVLVTVIIIRLFALLFLQIWLKIIDKGW